MDDVRRTKDETRLGTILAFAMLLILLGLPVAASACPGCKEALFDPAQLQQKLSTARGYALSIGVMLMVPVALIGGVAAGIIRAAKRKKHV